MTATASLERSEQIQNARLRIILAQRTSIERYPPVLHQAALLQALGEVLILDAPGRREELATQTASSIHRIRVRAADSGDRDTRLNRLRWAVRFAREYRGELATLPDVAIAYEPEAAALLLSGVRAGQTMRIIHLHEIPDTALYSSSIPSRLAMRYMLSRLNRADLIVVPDAHRAEYTMEVGGLSQSPCVVMNCPPLLRHRPPSKLIPWLRERGQSAARIVHYQGSVGPDHALEKIIASMRYWPPDAIFVVVGRASPSYGRELQLLAGREDMLSRVILVGEVPYAEVFSYAVGATVGVTLLEPHNKNWEFAAGASNKRFEYAALGIAQVTNAGAGIDRLFADTGIAAVVDVNSIEAIGTAIAGFLLDPTLATNVGDRARVRHLRSYNYQRQFEPVTERIREWTIGGASRVRR